MPRYALLVGLILGAAASRLIPHPPNFAPIGAIALFGGATFRDRRWAFATPLAAMLLSDAVLGFHSLMPFVYGSFALIVCLGLLLHGRRRLAPIGVAALSSSMIFFLITNLGVWAMGSYYPKTASGLLACYVAAIPFLGNTALGDAFYSAALFGGLALAERVSVRFRDPALSGSVRKA